LFRSGLTHALEAEGLSRLRSRLGIRTVIDLRNDGEIRDDGTAPFATHGIVHRRVALYGVTAATPEQRRERIAQMASRGYDWCATYQDLATRHPAAFVDFTRLLLQPGALPAVFHCTGGRDRTGVAAALLLSLLGVPEEAVAADYARTGALLLPHLHRYARIRERLGFDQAQMATLMATEAGDMLRFLQWLKREHGGAQTLLFHNGLTEAEAAEIRAVLLEA
jgi:hypothetical protein